MLKAAGYQVVRGGLATLRSTGDFAAAADTCLAGEHPTESIDDSSVPAVGQGYWYMVRGATCGVSGTFGSGLRDSGVDAAGLVCP